MHTLPAFVCPHALLTGQMRVTRTAGEAKADVQAQLDRLTKMMGGSMAPDLKKWVAQRVNILKQIAA